MPIRKRTSAGKLMGMVEAIRAHYATGEYSQRQLAALFDISQSSVSRIVTGFHHPFKKEN